MVYLVLPAKYSSNRPSQTCLDTLYLYFYEILIALSAIHSNAYCREKKLANETFTYGLILHYLDVRELAMAK